jgi:hypothetical protein
MLQIVTKMYFRDGVPLYSTDHREVLWTNRNFLRGDLVDLPVGELAPSSNIRPVSSVTVTVTEHLEAEHPDGEKSMHVATGGVELIDDLADVLSFGLNAVFNRDRDLVMRLVPSSPDEPRRASASQLFRNTFEPARYVPDEERDELRRFMTELLALKRSHFEAAIRVIRRIARATQRATTDPTLAYVDFVAALESLSDGVEAPMPTWDRMDGRKRKVFDKALDGVNSDLAERIRLAAMEAERLGFRSRFVAFVMANISPAFFRSEAVGAVAPLRSADLERVLKLAYDIRSLSVHALSDLPPEAWIFGNHAETVSPVDLGTMLSLEGLARLARHVVRSYIASAPAEVDETFNWRARLPGVLQMRAAPQYWIWNADGFHHQSVDRYFSGFVDQLTEVIAGRDEGVTNMKAVLQRIEELVPSTADGVAKDMMVAIYVLWHRVLGPDDHRPEAADFLAKYGHLLNQPGMPAFVVGLLTSEMPKWTDEQWRELAVERRVQRSNAQHLELPPSVDSALQVIVAIRMRDGGHSEEAQTLAAFAVEEMPGNESLVEWEDRFSAGETPELDLRALVLRLDPGVESQKAATTASD